MDARDLIKKAIKDAGSQQKLGEMIGCTQNAVYQAKKRGRVSPGMALRIHWAFHGAIPASTLRPDLWPTPDYVPAEPEKALAS